MKRKLIAILSFLLVSPFTFLGCSSGFRNPPSNFKEANLIGTWQATYGAERIDTLIIKADGTYKQIYHEPDGYTYESPWYNWHVERSRNGGIYVKLERMRYYPLGRELGESGGRYPTSEPEVGDQPILFYDPDEDRIVRMLDEVILGVSSVGGNWAPRGIVLTHMTMDPDTSVGFFLAKE
jgi:hypothetical protein